MGKADDDDINELFTDIMDIIDVDLDPDEIIELKNLLQLSLEAEYSVGYEDGYTNCQINQELDLQFEG